MVIFEIFFFRSEKLLFFLVEHEENTISFIEMIGLIRDIMVGGGGGIDENMELRLMLGIITHLSEMVYCKSF